MKKFGQNPIFEKIKFYLDFLQSKHRRLLYTLLVFLIIISLAFLIQVAVDIKLNIFQTLFPREDHIPLNQLDEIVPKDENYNDGIDRFDDGREESEPDFLIENFQVKLNGYPIEVKKQFDLFNTIQRQEGDLYDLDNYWTHIFQTGDVTSGIYIDTTGFKIDLTGYKVYILENGCSYFRVLASETQKEIFIIKYTFYHPSCWYDDSELKDYVYDIHTDFDYNNIFYLDYTVWHQFRSDGGYEYLFSTQPNINSVYTDSDDLKIVDERDGKYIYQNPYDEEHESFVIFTPEGFYSTGFHIPSIYEKKVDDESYYWQHDDSQYIPIKLVSGETVVNLYSTLSCDGENCSNYYIDKGPLDSLKFIGKGTDGTDIFIKKDPDDSFMKEIYNTHYINSSENLYNEIKEDDAVPFTYDQFVEAIPVIYWKNPFGKIIRFIRSDFINRFECCFVP